MNDKMQQTNQYLNTSSRVSYLLRLWRADEQTTFNWQASLENMETGKRIGFASLELLFTYLMDLVEGKGDVQDSEKEGQ